MERKTIVCCLPGWNFTTSWVSNWTGLFSALRDKFNVNVIFGYSNNIYVTRNNLVKNVLEAEQGGGKLDYILWMDDDNLLSFGQFEVLLNLLERNEQIAGAMGWYWLQPQGRQIDPSPSVGDLTENAFLPFNPKKMFAEPPVELVDAGGFGCFLAKWDEFKKLGDKPFSPIILEKENEVGFAGDDIAFFMRAKKAGLHFLVDKRIKVPHLKVRDADFSPVQFLDLPKEIVPALAIDGWMDHNELRWLYSKAKDMDSIVEIGSWKGRSSYALLSGCKGQVYCIDTWKGASDVFVDSGKTLFDIAKESYIYEEFYKNVGHFDNLVELMEDSITASKMFRTNADMIFIDAEHTLEAVLADLEAWQPKATKLLCGHDIDREGVRKALEIKGIDYKKGPGSIWFYEVAKEQQRLAAD